VKEMTGKKNIRRLPAATGSRTGEREEALARGTPAWTLGDRQIGREFRFRDFTGAAGIDAPAESRALKR
jgi:pterin-4a-carbinolamine dehydratase